MIISWLAPPHQLRAVKNLPQVLKPAGGVGVESVIWATKRVKFTEFDMQEENQQK